MTLFLMPHYINRNVLIKFSTITAIYVVIVFIAIVLYDSLKVLALMLIIMLC